MIIPSSAKLLSRETMVNSTPPPALPNPLPEAKTPTTLLISLLASGYGIMED